ncbi:alpha/beta hydrolase [Fuchsiella alkaliacetigena]|uniref:alpha/beta hydrolase n=1 Tax=Fuchsiella alkaliacetigena TaxID=957042 RepID=UPI00200A3511|nr:alpha/beta hydrolase [Fuchsiella alkaliacetigena]MCK8823868.1 alpha/beta hydrolase [Fuchsiella alkaliacetigena]
MEKPVLFGKEGSEMVGILHIPDSKTDYPKPAVIICHGFKGDKVGPHRIFVKMARKLAEKGIVAFRFDFRGSGDSKGSFKETKISSQIEDGLEAIKFVSKLEQVNSSRLALLGFSLGGLIASCVAARSTGVKFLVLWSAIADLEEVFTAKSSAENLASLNEQGYMDLGGLKLGANFVEELEQIEPLAEIEEYQGSAFIIHGSEDQVVPVKHSEEYYDLFSAQNCRKHIVLGADHTYNKSEWEAEVLNRTSQWLIENI